MKKFISFTLSFLLIALSCFVPVAFAENAYTEELLGETFHRITFTDKAFAAETARDITFTVPKTGNYALFVNKEDAAENAYSAVFTQAASVAGTDSDYSVTLGGTDKDARGHKYNYTRVGATPVQKSGSVYLYKGACTLSLTALNATSIKYVDLRGTDITIGDGKTGIIPADYFEYSSVTASNHVNGEIGKGVTLSEGFTYFNAPNGLTKTRQFHLESGRTATYNLNITKAQNYRISLRSAGYVWSSNPSGTANLSFKASLNDLVVYESPVEALELTTQSNTGKDTWDELGVFALSEGITPLKITTTRGRYLYDLRVEATTEAITANATKLPASVETANITAGEGVSLNNDYFTLENGESVSFSFKAAGDRPLDIFLSGLKSTGNTVNYTCQLDENAPVSGTLNGFCKLLENQTVSEGVHTMTLTNTSESAVLCPVSFTIADAEKEDTTLSAYEAIPVSKQNLITNVPLNKTSVSYGKILFADNRYHILGGGELTFLVDIEEAGYYTFYGNIKAAQTTTKVYLDGETDISNVMYDDMSYAHNNAAASTNYLDRKLTNGLVYLESGVHTVTIKATELCEVNSLSVRVSDGAISADITDETVIPAWDFSDMQNINTGWYFPTQYYQSNSEKVQKLDRGAYTNLRNIIIHQSAKYTYTVYAEETGHYDFSAFFTSSNNTVEFLFSVDGLTNCYAVGTPQSAMGEAVSTEPMFLKKGYHNITVSRTTRTYTTGTARVYGFAFRKSAANTALATDIQTNIEASFDAPVTGTVYAALYKGNKLVGVGTKAADGINNVVMTVSNAEAPDRIKVLAWESLASLKPVASEVIVTDIEKRKINLHLMGDSVCVGYNDAAFPQQGWGVYIGEHFDENINVANHAKGGASTKTYQTLGLWDNVKKAIEPGDYVIINFGLNDFYNISETGKGTTIEQYKDNLTLFCTTILEKGATPILVSTIPECKENYTSLQNRAIAMSQVADTLGVTFLDLNTTLNAEWLFDENGNYSADKTLETFNYYYLSEPAFKRLEQEWGKTVTDAKWEYIKNTPDRTHTNEDGAEYVAATIAKLLSETNNPLTKYLVN